MKKLIGAILSLVLLLSAPGITATAAAASKTAVPTSSTVLVDGKNVAFQAYTIDSSNYFKLRDIAMALSGSGKQFSISVDNGIIMLTSGKAYTPVGGELTSSGNAGNTYADASSFKVYLDGSLINITAYTIGGYNYFKLRDLGAAINFGVGWDGGMNTITIDTTAGYSADTSGSSNTGSSGSSSGVKSEIGFYDSSVNYANQKKYEIVYMTASSSAIYDALSKEFAKWAGRLNCTYSDWSANGDADAYLMNVMTYADQGVDGFILDPDSAIYPRVIEIMNEIKMPWISGMTQPLDDNGKLMHPAVVYDNTQAGVAMAQFNCDWVKKNWPSANASEIGAIFIGYSVVPVLEQRAQGYRATFLKNFPNSAGNYFFADGVSTGSLTAETAYNLTAVTMAAHKSIKYWLISGFFDDYTEGAARAAENIGKASTTVCSTFGGYTLIKEWDSGADTCWKGALISSNALQSEPVICGLYALMTGKATPETLWPEWINKKAGDKYATLQPPTVFITKDNYQEYMECVDAYTGFNESPYSYHGTQFPMRATPPASYGG